MRAVAAVRDSEPARGRALCLALIALGVALRLRRYFDDPPLWFDEAALALNIVQRDFAGLATPLDDAQVAPFGFTALAKLITLALGESERALRLLPLLAGIAVLLLGWRVARALLQPSAVPFAVGLLAVSAPLIRYSAEVKQYSTDAAVALLLVLAALRFRAKAERAEVHRTDALALGALGAVAQWLSLPAVFVLAAAGAALAIPWMARGARAELSRLSIAGALWAASFAALYWLVLKAALAHDFLDQFWGGSDEPGSPAGGAFMPLPPTSVHDLSWFAHAFFGLFTETAGFELAGIAALAFITGAAAAPAAGIGSPLALALLLGPLGIALLASGLRVYPFFGRLLLFALPGLLLVIAAGAAAIAAAGRRGVPALAAGLLLLLFLHPAAGAMRVVLGERPKWNARAAIAHIVAHREPGDRLYVYYGGQTQMRYYARRFGLAPDAFILGVCARDDWPRYERDLDQLDGRVWVLLSHWLPDEKAFFVEQLDRRGTQREIERFGNVWVYRYELARR